MQAQKYSIRPNGKIQGGNASYSFDEQTGEINYALSASVRIALWISHTVEESGKYTLIPFCLLSSNLSAPGDLGRVITIGDAEFTVVAISPGHASVTVTVPGKNVNGSAMLDTSEKFVKMSRVTAIVGMPIVGAVIIEAIESVEGLVPAIGDWWTRLKRWFVK